MIYIIDIKGSKESEVRYVYLALSRETYFSTDRLDATASRAQAVPVAMVAVCILHWSLRSEHRPMTRFLFVLTFVVGSIKSPFKGLLRGFKRRFG